MCFDTTKRQRKSIAEEDIICWKTGYLLYHPAMFMPSYRHDFDYLPNITQEIVRLRKTKRVYGSGLIEFVITKGYHSYTTKEHAQLARASDEDIGMFIIPRGTAYYHNKEDKEYVSETIIWTGVIIK